MELLQACEEVVARYIFDPILKGPGGGLMIVMLQESK